MLKAKCWLARQSVPSREKNTGSFFLFLIHLYRSRAGWRHTYCVSSGLEGRGGPQCICEIKDMVYCTGLQKNLPPHTPNACGNLPKVVSTPHNGVPLWKPQAERHRLNAHWAMPSFVSLETLQVQYALSRPLSIAKRPPKQMINTSLLPGQRNTCAKSRTGSRGLWNIEQRWFILLHASLQAQKRRVNS